MADDDHARVIALTGATATGKTGLGIALAERLGGEIISMDSRQVYRGMDIGTAKATATERERVLHHGLDLIGPGTRYSAGRFARDARRWITEIRGRGRIPILVGGTGFFLRALLQPLFDEPPMNPERRSALQSLLDGLEEEELYRWLRRLDPEAASKLEGAGGQQRASRALEVVLLTGRTLGWWQRHHPGPDPQIHALVVVLELPREQLYERINQRVDRMLEDGFVAEVRHLLEAGHRQDQAGMTATGYRELAQHLGGRLDLDEAAERIRRATRRYARRQLTWFRHQLPPDAVRLDAARPVEELVDEVVERWEEGA